MLGALEVGREELVFLVKGPPALARAVDDDLVFEAAAFRVGELELMGGVAVGGAEDRGDPRGLEAVLKVVLEKLVDRRDRDGAELVQAEHRAPELPVALEEFQTCL